jgi:hypothetical protein
MMGERSVDVALFAAAYERRVCWYWLDRSPRSRAENLAVLGLLVQFVAEARLAAGQRLRLRMALEGIARRLTPAGMKLAAITLCDLAPLRIMGPDLAGLN